MKTQNIVAVATVSAVVLFAMVLVTNNNMNDSQLAAQSTSSLQTSIRPAQSSSQVSSVMSADDVCKYLKAISQKAYNECIQRLKDLNLQSHPVVSTIVDQYLGVCSTRDFCKPSFGQCDKDDCMREFKDGRCWYRPSNINGRLQSTNICFVYYAPCKDRANECMIADVCSPKSGVAMVPNIISGRGRDKDNQTAKDLALDDMLANGQQACEAMSARGLTPECDNGCTQNDDIEYTFSYGIVTYTETSVSGQEKYNYRAETQGVCTMVRSCKKR